MASLQEFLAQLLNEGKIAFGSAKVLHERPTEAALAVLAAAFETTLLSVAGPRIAWDGKVAWDAVELVRQSSWALVNRAERAGDLKKRVLMPGSPVTPSHHLSADLMLRYVPQILKRARGLDASDPLLDLLAQVMRRWPLSGVLSDVQEKPLAPLDFGGHAGLLLLYAERLARNDRASWRPEQGSAAAEYDELVRTDRSATGT
jgi:hypothetical protein